MLIDGRFITLEPSHEHHARAQIGLSDSFTITGVSRYLEQVTPKGPVEIHLPADYVVALFENFEGRSLYGVVKIEGLGLCYKFFRR